MILLIEKTWFLWWMFAIVLIVRWFHVLSPDAVTQVLDTPAVARDNVQAISGQLA